MGEDRRKEVNGRRLEDLWSRWDKRVRDSIIFSVGILGIINELFILDDPRPYSLVFLASLIGVPFVLSADESKFRKKNGSDDTNHTQVPSKENNNG